MAGTVSEARRPKVLMLAAACSPDQGSEPGVGWNRAVQSARYFDTWVLAMEGPRAAEVRRYLQSRGEIPGLHFVFVSRGILGGLLMKSSIFFYLGYNLWHRRAYRVARRLHCQNGFDLVHQVTLNTFREPGYLWKLGVPFIWGPVGGTQDYPWRFLGEAGFVAGASEALRSVLNWLQLRLSPRVWRAARRARPLIAANSTNQRDFVRIHGVTPVLMTDAGMQSMTAQPRPCDREHEDLHILWCGNTQPRKALSLLIKALAELPPDVHYELRVVGCKPEANRWRQLAREMGVDKWITWMGWIPHCETLSQYDWADLFVFTSLRDTSGNVVLEAMAAGLPVICLDHQGVKDLVTDDAGIRIPVTCPRKVVMHLREAVAAMARDRVRREQLGQGALRRAADFLWSRQGDAMAAVYRQTLAEIAGRHQPAIASADDRAGASCSSEDGAASIDKRSPNAQ